MKLNVPMLPLSQSNAVGLIIAHGKDTYTLCNGSTVWLNVIKHCLFSGSIGDGESALTPDVYISDDGGYSWLFALKGPHHYAILDSGGLIVAVEHTNFPVNQIK